MVRCSVSFRGGLIAVVAWRYARTKAALNTGNRTASVSRDRQRTRNALVVAQVAMALVLLVSALLMIRTFAALRNVQPGFTDAAHLETMRIAIPNTIIADERTVTRTEQAIEDKIAAIPGVQSVGYAVSAPMEGFEQGKVCETLRLPMSYWVVALLGIGHLKGPDKYNGGRFDISHTVLAEEFGRPYR